MPSSPGSLGALGPFVAQQSEIRFRNIERALRDAIQKPGDPDAIHDLRVAIRRAVECLRTFAQFFDSGRSTFFRKRIKKLAKRCGAVRNCDIARDVLKEIGMGRSKAAAGLRKRRRETQKDLTRALKRLQNGNPLPKHPIVQEGQPGMWDASRDVVTNASAILPKLFADLLKAGQKATAPNAHYDTLHGFRLLAKRFRYTLELFQPVYGPELKKRLALLGELQTKLGGINDCVTAQNLVTGHAKTCHAIEILLRQRKEDLKQFFKRKLGSASQASWRAWLRNPRHGQSATSL
jgi:CHAD domain-containing protein